MFLSFYVLFWKVIDKKLPLNIFSSFSHPKLNILDLFIHFFSLLKLTAVSWLARMPDCTARHILLTIWSRYLFGRKWIFWGRDFLHDRLWYAANSFIHFPSNPTATIPPQPPPPLRRALRRRKDDVVERVFGEARDAARDCGAGVLVRPQDATRQSHKRYRAILGTRRRNRLLAAARGSKFIENLSV